MILFNIIGVGILDVADPSGVAFKTENQQFRFCDISLGRTTEFSVPATDHNREILLFGEDPAEDGRILRRVYPCQMVYGGEAKTGTIKVTAYDTEAFKCVFTIGNAEWIDKLQNLQLSDCISSWAKGVLWSVNNPPTDANLADPAEGAQILRYDNGTGGDNNWQLVPSVNIGAFIEDILTNATIPYTMNVPHDYWMVAGSMKGGTVDQVTMQQTSYSNFSVTQWQGYISVEDITLEWATANLFGALIGGGSATSKAFRATQDIKISFPSGMATGKYLVKWNSRLPKCEVAGATFDTSVYQNINGKTLDFSKGDIFFFAEKPLVEAVTYYGWKTTDISAMTVQVYIERNADLQLGEVWYMRANMPDMTVFEFLKSVALATGLDLFVDGETGVSIAPASYGSVFRKLDDVISVDTVARRVESWGTGTRKATIVFDSDDYVTDRIVSRYDIDNTQLEDKKESKTRFSEGNAGTNGVVIEDVEDGKFKAKRWTIALVDRNHTYLQRVGTPDPVGCFDIADNSTAVVAKALAPLSAFFDLTPSTVWLWRGMAYVWTDANWSDGVLTLTLQKVSEPTEVPNPV